MNKKRVISLLLVLFFVVAGAFADVSVTMPSAATATLKANIGEYLDHGFTIGTVKYNPSITIENAFAAPSQFVYGYKTNAVGHFTFTMNVGNFISTSNANNIVKIASVTSSLSSITYTSTGYKIFSDYTATTVTGVEQNAESTITITPAATANVGSLDHTGSSIVAAETVQGGAAGSYVSTITFTIASV
ncbi:hypothetical protein [uncultured Sphaerochaeta sp.]|uniref:hypothetical protein n=1 Tax=uncultured Sphaerochaeta sp. TaxID=886478 RepID=UPI002A0A7874|nr:hypothetical protein [uncultured Sphaerochaeta sp.]